MEQYQEMYKQKKVTIEEALSYIRSGDQIHHSVCAMEPTVLLGNLHTICGKVTNVNVITALEIMKYPFAQDPTYADTFCVESMFMMAPSRAAFKNGLVSYVPVHLHNMVRSRFDYKKPSVFLCSATPMDSHGYFRCSLSQLQESKLAEVCDRIILEVNPNIPFVGGDTAIHISQIDCLIEVDTPVPQTPRIEPNETEQTIGGYIAELIHDGDTIQLGIGGIPNAVGKALLSKHDLGVHTEMLTNSISDLVEANVVTGRKKNIHKGKIIATFALGDATLYKMMDHNPAVEILRAEYVNDPFVIKQNDNMVSINTCISIDLTGQVNSESIGAQQYSGTGGQSDTAYGAIHAKNGRSIIALTSTALDGKISSIVPVLAPGAVVSLQRNNVDLVVTEYGVARLRGRNISERVENLIAIAHPDFREELRVGARQYDLR